MRSVTAFFIAPLVVAAGWSTYAFSESRLWSEKLAGFVVSMTIAYVYCIAVTVVVALPLYFLLRRFNLVRSWSLIASGAAISWATTMLLLPKSLQKEVDGLVFLGAAAGLTFWLIAKGGTRSNPSLERP